MANIQNDKHVLLCLRFEYLLSIFSFPFWVMNIDYWFLMINLLTRRRRINQSSSLFVPVGRFVCRTIK